MKQKKIRDFTNFQRSVFNEIKKIPKGQTISYKKLAENIGRPTAYRAVANECGKNTDPTTIPCHRVVKSNGDIGGYSLKGGINKKRDLLKLENKNYLS